MATVSAALSIECSNQPLDLSFHPSRSNILAAALVDGTVEVHDYTELLNASYGGGGAPDAVDDDDEVDSLVSSNHLHRQLLPTSAGGTKQAAARCVNFSTDGLRLYSGGTAGDLVACQADRLTTFSTTHGDPVLWRVPDASYNKSPLQVVQELPDSRLLVTGDEAGGVRVWDTRLLDGGEGDGSSIHKSSFPRGCVHSWKEHDDYVSGVEHSADGHTLLVSSADCTLSVYDLRNDITATNKERFRRRSDDQEDELLSIQLIKNGRKVVCGTGEGVLAVWSWGTWGDVSDRFPGHPASVDALLKIDEDTLLTGSSDGLLRVVSIHPDKLLGVLGDHDGFPIEKLGMNADRGFVGSVSHDTTIRLFDASMLKDDYDGLQEGGMVPDERKDGSEDDWDDMDEDSDDSEQGEKLCRKNATRLKSENEKFFEDL